MPAWCPLCRREIPIPGYLLPSDIQVLPSHHAQRGRCCPEGGFPFRVAGLTARDRKLDRVQSGGLSTPDRTRIKDEWIQQAVDHPLQEEVQADGRVRRWTLVAEENRYYRVVLLEDRETVHNAFFDSSFADRSDTP